MTLVSLVRLFGRRGVGDPATVALPAIAFAVVTLCVTVVAGGVHAFFALPGDQALVYRILSLIALVLLGVPLATLGASAARLAARRRDERLSTLRLLGASTRLVSALTVVEATTVALAGALAGAVASLAALPFGALLRFDGQALGAAIWPPLWAYPGVVAGVMLLAAASAAIGLRRVMLTPLGVRTRTVVPRVRRIRAVIAVLVIAAAAAAMSRLGLFGSIAVVIAVMLGCFAAVLAVLGLVGPLVLRGFARGWLRRARTAGRLLAARSVLDDPKAAWRQVSGVAMVSFVAVFAGVGAAFAEASASGGDPVARTLAADIRSGVLITLIMSFAMVACAVGVNQAAAVLDRRALYVALDRAGMPARVMHAARSRAVLAPLLVVTIGAAVCAAVVVLPLTGIALFLEPLTLLVIAGCLAAGIGLVWAGLLATRPVLAGVLAAGLVEV
ncbi:FtsX-like permease family protein [Gryllotalpicola ginsengisoli]|uniref:FtsX-like permease family protein n=1 Tax=Gryllotalpicola ginsengisoli TaxID=444608 RepID=UPI0003B514C6|nr:FtsX-like permease family protein [Gryllotalpicola ginsengisoli]